MTDSMDLERFREIRAFAEFVSERCVEHRFTQREVTVVVACLVDDILNNHPDTTFEQALAEVCDLVRDLREVFAGVEERPN